MPTFLQRSALILILAAGLAAYTPFADRGVAAQETSPVAGAATATVKESGRGADERRLNWPSAWTSEVTETDGKASMPAPAAGPSGNATGSETGAAAPPARPQTAQAPTSPATPPKGATLVEKPAAAPGNGSEQIQGEAHEPVSAAPAAAEAPPAEKPQPVELKGDIAKQVDDAKAVATKLESVAKSVERLRDRDAELSALLPSIEKLVADAEAAGKKLQPALADVRSQVDKLGPAPAEGASEADEIAAERKRLNATTAEIDGAIKSTELTQVRGRQLIARIQGLLLENFRSGLLQRSSSILSPAVWQDGLSALPDAARQLHAIVSEWSGRASLELPALVLLIVAALIAGGGFQIASRRIRTRLRQADAGDVTVPTFSRRCLVASLEGPLRALPKIISAAVLIIGLNSLDLLYLQMEGFAGAAFKAVVIAATGLAFTTAYLQPGRKQWRVIHLGDKAAWTSRKIIRIGVLVFAIDVLIRQVIDELSLPLPVSIVWTSLVALAFAATFIAGARIKLAVPKEGPARLALLGGHAHKIPLIVAALAILAAVFSGYVALGHFIATRILVLAAAIFLLAIFYLANRAIAREPEQYKGGTDLGEPAQEDAADLPLDVRQRVARGLSLLLDFVLFVIAVPVLLIALGFSRPEISTLLKQAVFGFEIGGVEISLFKVGIALGLFAAIVIGSRMLQRWLGDTVLHPSRIEQGLGNSIRTGVGYLGFIVAAIAGLSYAGLDITNLAIVAGALSVGIGFGLQSIVNNFVSGLILLVERPIKVGDWIKVGDQEGNVRKISVRSTEIETFDRASVIVPNSELISGTVVNLTLRNSLARKSIQVGVSYDSDPETVHRLLLECADECDLVARHPAPFVVFENFGSSSLDFTLRIYVSDVSSNLAAQTQVRKAIFAKFRDAGIEIPFPQRDVNVRDTAGLKAALQQLLDERWLPDADGAAVAATGGTASSQGGGETS